MKLAPVFLLLLALPVTLPVGAGQYYRWVDAQGKVHYGDQPAPAGTKQATEKSFKDGGSAKTAPQPQISVTLYSTTTCGQPCEQAKSHLSKRSISYTSKDPATDVAANEALRANGGTARVPTLMIGSEKLEGYNQAAWDAALNLAGFPKPNSDKPGTNKKP